MRTRQEIIDRYKWIGQEVERLVMNPTDEEKEASNFIDDELNRLGPESRVLEWVMNGDWSPEEPTSVDVEALMKWMKQVLANAEKGYFDKVPGTTVGYVNGVRFMVGYTDSKINRVLSGKTDWEGNEQNSPDRDTLQHNQTLAVDATDQHQKPSESDVQKLPENDQEE